MSTGRNVFKVEKGKNWSFVGLFLLASASPTHLILEIKRA